MPSPANSQPAPPSNRASRLSKPISIPSLPPKSPAPESPLSPEEHTENEGLWCHSELSDATVLPACAKRMSRRAVEESLCKKISTRRLEERAEMKIIVEIPTAFRRFTNGSASIECAPATLAELLA